MVYVDFGEQGFGGSIGCEFEFVVSGYGVVWVNLVSIYCVIFEVFVVQDAVVIFHQMIVRDGCVVELDLDFDVCRDHFER